MTDSLVFKIVDNDDFSSMISDVSILSNKLGALGVSFKDISMAWSAHGIKGVKNVFANSITEMDLEMLKNYNEYVRR